MNDKLTIVRILTRTVKLTGTEPACDYGLSVVFRRHPRDFLKGSSECARVIKTYLFGYCTDGFVSALKKLFCVGNSVLIEQLSEICMEAVAEKS